ncbi:putative porin [Sphingomonas sp. BT-65]|uniref:putative porin n=1 Tax=Sphingomonas sp. BT-65 TaxID=2989821 RepID=UPI0022359258|nr:putative porin [Sphingomonas sp. BT-65]MCW4460712.1 putative porin [Sphingomonas sp. BT-65]
MRPIALPLAAMAMASPALAQDSRLDALERQLADQQQRIRQLEALVAQQAALIERIGATAPAPVSAPSPQLVAATATPATPATISAMRIPGLDVSGDLRIRQEWNYGSARDRSRSVLRARLRASYAVTEKLAIGTQIATGDPDDPNSTDVTLGNFLDDFAVSLDQAFIRYADGGLTAVAGKFPQIFQRTDMVWDGDVSPQGLGASYAVDLGGGAKADARALYFVIDEASTARDSDMLGGQVTLTAPLASDLKLGFAGSYYHYRLGSVAGADAGDFRGNLLSGGRYLSDFHLVEGLGSLTYAGLSPRWPLTFTADYVRNLGAAVPGDTGFNLEFAAGRTAQRGDWRIAYNYSEVEVDSVFAAFSHDNLDLSTNYRLHGFGIGYVPASNLLLDLIWYHYQPLDARYTTAPLTWLDRIRLNFMVSF